MPRPASFKTDDPEDGVDRGGAPGPGAPVGAEQGALAALKSGDPDGALSILMAAYGGSIFRYCCQVMRNRHLAEEALQETFFQAHRDFSRFARKSTLRTWLYSIAHHRCLDALKKERHQAKKAQGTPELPETADPGPRPDDSLEARKLSDALRECLGKLSAKARSALLLRYQQELTYPEMSAIVGDREPTLQARVTRALPLLRECVERMGYQL